MVYAAKSYGPYMTNQERLAIFFKEKGITKENIKPKRLLSNTLDLLNDTKIEILIGAGLLGVGSVLLGYHLESQREYKRPLSFSEITQIRRDAEFSGEEVNPRTSYHATTMDMLNKIFECSNRAHNSSGKKDIIHSFAKELDMRVSPTHKFHTNNLKDFFKSIPSDARNYGMTLSNHYSVMKGVAPVNSSFDNAWSHHTRDTPRTEISCTTDSEGKESCTTIEVCDYTTHTYSYDQRYAMSGEKALDDIISKHPDLKYPYKAQLASKTNAEGEMAAEVSREKKGEHLRLSQTELHDIANKFHYGSTLTQNLPKVNTNWQALISDSARWDNVKGSAKREADNYSNRTCCGCGDPGPISYQVSESIVEHSGNVYRNIDEIVQAPAFTVSSIPKLENMIDKFIRVELNYEKGDSEKLMTGILDLSAEVYYKNFKDGYDVAGYRGWMVALYGLLGAVSGLIIGAGVDYAGDRFGIWDKLKNSRKND